MNRGDKILVFVDILGFAKLTEDWPRRIVHRRHGSMRLRATSESVNRLGTFHSVLDQTIDQYARMASISAMSFSDCAFVTVGNPFLSAEVAVSLMQHFILAGVPVRMGMAAGTFSPGRMSTEVVGDSTVSRAIFYGTAIVRAHQAESCGLPGMRIFLHESLESVFSRFDHRHKVLRFESKRRAVVGELSYLHHADSYVNAKHADPLDDDRELWRMTRAMRAAVEPKAPRRVHQHYVQTLAALNRMRPTMGRLKFKRSDA